jgi:hypothetical protein
MEGCPSEAMGRVALLSLKKGVNTPHPYLAFLKKTLYFTSVIPRSFPPVFIFLYFMLCLKKDGPANGFKY